jgi:hypothetical protein
LEINAVIPILPAQHAIKYTPQVVQIYQYDASPIDGRQPLLLVHGLKDEYVRRLHWEKVCKFLNANPDFRKRYKIFLARYDSLAREEEIANAFKPALCELADSQHKKLFVVALSISGDIVRNAMDDPNVDKSISKVISMGSPFHGSPLFNESWIFYSSFKHHKFLITRLDRYLAYGAYFKYHPNLLKDYYWDNYDEEVPDVGHYKFRLPFLVEGNLVPPAKPPSGINWDRNGAKFITYGGYFQNQYIEKMNRSRVFIMIHAPFSFFYTTIPAHLGNEHAALRLLNYEIAFIDQRQKHKYSSFSYNDGIAPVSSTLSLAPSEMQISGDEAHMLNSIEDQTKKVAFSPDKNEDVDALKDPPEELKLKSTASKARLFADIDHISFLDGYKPIASPKNLVDQLSPTEKPRPIFDWLLSDILN